VDANVQSVRDFPDGYPKLAAFLDSDEKFMVYRRFGYLQSRLLLEKQEHLQQLEEELESLDQEEAETGSTNLITIGSYDTERYTARRELMQRIECNLQRYGTHIKCSERQIMGLTQLNSFPSSDCSIADSMQSSVFRRVQERGELH
jgi:hypothetical protein